MKRLADMALFQLLRLLFSWLWDRDGISVSTRFWGVVNSVNRIFDSIDSRFSFSKRSFLNVFFFRIFKRFYRKYWKMSLNTNSHSLFDMILNRQTHFTVACILSPNVNEKKSFTQQITVTCMSKNCRYIFTN